MTWRIRNVPGVWPDDYERPTVDTIKLDPFFRVALLEEEVWEAKDFERLAEKRRRCDKRKGRKLAKQFKKAAEYKVVVVPAWPSNTPKPAVQRKPESITKVRLWYCHNISMEVGDVVWSPSRRILTRILEIQKEKVETWVERNGSRYHQAYEMREFVEHMDRLMLGGATFLKQPSQESVREAVSMSSSSVPVGP